ncbi:MAG: AAA family ATPase [Candidatus Omnitrophota bacterium]
MNDNHLPAWAQRLKEQFCSSTTSQFLIYGNIFDVVEYRPAETSIRFLPVKDFLEDAMLDGYDTVIGYDRGNGIRVAKGDKDWSDWLRQLSVGAGEVNTVDPLKALKLIDRYILRTLNLQAINTKEGEHFKKKIAVIIDFAQFIVPNGESFQFANDLGSILVFILNWANDPAILNSNIATILITEKLNDINSLIVENPHTSKIEIKLPSEDEMAQYIDWLRQGAFPQMEKDCDVDVKGLAKYMTGLNRIAAKNIIAFALKNGYRITQDFLKSKKKEMIEKECQGLLDFFEPSNNLDIVAGHEPVKKWLREDAALLKLGKVNALPMGYLIAGRIGTGKTFLVQSWAGELGVPCVVWKNFRDKWVGATESNLEKIFAILHALGEVVVFVDEADQMTGKRDSGAEDGGLSGRIYAALAKEMSDTKNRGRIIWVFATSRPDLVEVDLKRQGRLDVHIPLFPPQNEAEYRELFVSVAKKLKCPLELKDIPALPAGAEYSGNEIEGIMVRALRIFELAKEPKPSLGDIIQKVVAEVRANANTRKLEYMDLIAARECTDAGFLPAKFAGMTPEEMERRIDELHRFV